ncbi:MAG: TonB-dependent receptor, partial [Candidatus Neomarinimicrobiota bacterium]
MKNSVWVLILGLLLSVASGQGTFRVRGKIVNEHGYQPLVGANLIVTCLDDSTQYYATSDQTGRYDIRNLKPGKYSLKITYIGFHELVRKFEISNRNEDLGTNLLSFAAIQMGQVNVEKARPLATQKGDTTQYSADSYKTAPDASAEDLVAKMPGITLESGQVKAQGETVKKVLVDNRPFFGDDPNAALRNLPAEIVEKIQVFDQQSEQAQMTGFDDGNTSKTMNIVTREGMNNGQFGKVYGGYGEDGKYRLGGNLNYFNGQRRISFIGQSNNVNIQNFATEDLLGVMGSSGRRHGGRSGGPPTGGMGGGPSSGGMRGGGGISDFLVSQQGGISTTHAFGINYQDQWLKVIDVSGSYFFNWSENNNDLELWRDYFTSVDPSQTYEETELVNSTNINHRFNLRLSGDISENDLIRFTPRISIQQNSGASDLAAGNYSGNLATSLLNNIFNSDLETANYSGTLLYRHRFGRRDRALTARITASATAYTGDSDQAAQSITTDDSTTDTTSSSQESQLLQDGTILQASLSYSEPLSENGGLILSYEIGRNGTTSDKETWLPDELSGDYSLLDTLHSNIFSNGLFEQSAEIGYRYRTGGSMLMVRCEYNLSTISNDQNFPYALESDHTWKSYLPSAIFRYKLDNTRNLSLVYRSSVRTPTIQQLQAVVDNSNPLQQSTGNPDLKQQTEHRLMLNYAASNPDRG